MPSRLRRELATGVGGKVSGKALAFVTQVLIARVLGPVAFAGFGFAWSLMRMVSTVGTLGADQAAVKFGSEAVARGRNPRPFLRTWFRVAFGVGGVAAAALWMVAPWLAESAGLQASSVTVLRAASVGLLVGPAGLLASSASRIGGSVRAAILADDVLPPVVLAAGLALAWGGAIPLSATVMVLVAGVGAWVGWLVATLHLPGGTAEAPTFRVSSRTMAVFLSGAWIAALAPMAMSWLPRLLGAGVLEAGELGVFIAVSQVTLSTAFILSGITIATVPEVARLAAEPGDESRRRMNATLLVTTRWAALLGFLPLLLFLALPVDLLRLLLGGDYVGGASALRLLALGQMANVGTGAVVPVLIVLGRGRGLAVLGVALVLLEALLLFVLGPRWGLAGVAVSEMVVTVILYLAALVLLRRAMGRWPVDGRYLAAVLASAATLVVLAGLRAGLDGLGVGRAWLPVLLLAPVVYAVAQRISGGVRRSEVAAVLRLLGAGGTGVGGGER